MARMEDSTNPANFSSRQVNAEIKRTIWPALRGAGFDKFNARNGWRHAPDSIAVVKFQSFSSYHATRHKCTSFSFCVNLGVYYPCVHDTPWASRWPVLYRVKPTEPPEHGCHARLHLEKRISQPEYPRLGIWYIRADGSNLTDIVDDALKVIIDIGLPWLERFTSLPYALAKYQQPREVGRKEHVCALGTFKAAVEGSALAFSLKDYAAAKRLWNAFMECDRRFQNPEWVEQARTVISLCDEREMQS